MMMIPLEAIVSCAKLVVLESLHDSDAPTGSSLIEKMRLHGVSYPVELIKIETASAFRDAMTRLASEVAPGSGAALHIEMHGDFDSGLLVARTGESLSWREFASLCQAVNRACANNLLVTMAVCRGARALEGVYDPHAVAPFCVLIASDVRTTVKDLVRFFEFYDSLLRVGDVGRAQEQLPDHFALHSCEMILAIALIEYVVEATMGKGLRLRVERLVTESRKAAPHVPLRVARRHFRKHLAFSREEFERYRRSFLMADQPSNRDRFELSYEQLMAFAQQHALRPPKRASKAKRGNRV